MEYASLIAKSILESYGAQELPGTVATVWELALQDLGLDEQRTCDVLLQWFRQEKRPPTPCEIIALVKQATAQEASAAPAEPGQI